MHYSTLLALLLFALAAAAHPLDHDVVARAHLDTVAAAKRGPDEGGCCRVLFSQIQTDAGRTEVYGREANRWL
ncbi:hypothetical protein BV25DRAFT_1831548 [Artomyces pyxidatus]|uniref:Uncharacterized protein n=1 Tax=Artomyces pyxidatus TaxID=48021 RepID=A0ACB8SLE4_9AGAM|nr:hypothetical protein BV25DRAFT_1831548 [Artomyces pyxidatus]